MRTKGLNNLLVGHKAMSRASGIAQFWCQIKKKELQKLGRGKSTVANIITDGSLAFEIATRERGSLALVAFFACLNPFLQAAAERLINMHHGSETLGAF